MFITNRFLVQIMINGSWIDACEEKRDLLDAEYQYMSLNGYSGKRIILRAFPTYVEWNGLQYKEHTDTVIKSDIAL